MKLLAAIDLSRASSYVIEAVHRVVLATDAEVWLLHAVMPLPGSASTEFNPVFEPAELVDRYLDEQEQLAGLAGQLLEAGVKAVPLLVQGDPVRAVLHEAGRLAVELIVVGSHGHGVLFDALVGSVSAGILRQAKVPVLVVPVRES